MAWYVVSYDIRGDTSPEAYERISAALRTATDWCKPLLSHWIISTPQSAGEVIATLLRLGAIDDDDGLIVIETTMRGDFRRIQNPAYKWLIEKLTLI